MTKALLLLILVIPAFLGATHVEASAQGDIVTLRQQVKDELKSPYKAQVQAKLSNATDALNVSDTATACALLAEAEPIITTAGNATGSGITSSIASDWNGQIDSIRAQIPCN